MEKEYCLDAFEMWRMYQRPQGARTSLSSKSLLFHGGAPRQVEKGLFSALSVYVQDMCDLNDFLQDGLIK